MQKVVKIDFSLHCFVKKPKHVNQFLITELTNVTHIYVEITKVMSNHAMRKNESYTSISSLIGKSLTINLRSLFVNSFKSGSEVCRVFVSYHS